MLLHTENKTKCLSNCGSGTIYGHKGNLAIRIETLLQAQDDGMNTIKVYSVLKHGTYLAITLR